MEDFLKFLYHDRFLDILYKKGTFNNNLYNEDSYETYKADATTLKCLGLYSCMNFKEIPWENLHDTPYWFSKRVSTMLIANDPGGHDQRVGGKKVGVQSMVHPVFFMPWYFKKEELKTIKSADGLIKALYQKIKADKRDPRLFYVWGYIYKIFDGNEAEFVKFIKSTYFTDSCKCYAGGELASQKMRQNCFKKVLLNEIQTVNPKTLLILGNKTSTYGNLMKNITALKKTEKLAEIPYVGDKDKKVNSVYAWKFAGDLDKVKKDLGLTEPKLKEIIILPHVTFFARLNNWDFKELRKLLV